MSKPPVVTFSLRFRDSMGPAYLSIHKSDPPPAPNHKAGLDRDRVAGRQPPRSTFAVHASGPIGAVDVDVALILGIHPTP